MSDPLEIIAVRIGGQAITGWSSVSITLSVEKPARAAQLSIADFDGQGDLLPGDAVVIAASGTTVLTGYLRTIAPHHDEGGHGIDLTIESKTVDLVEASIDHPSGFVADKDIGEIARAFDTSGVGVLIDEAFAKEPRSFVNLGASLYDHLKPLARSYGAFLYDTADGQLRIAKNPRGRHDGHLSIGPGGNIIAGTAEISEKGRHKTVKVRGQVSRGTGTAALQPQAEASDATVERSRTKIIVHESEATSAKLKERAERYVKRAAGYSRQATITVAGWRDEGGRIWEPHYLVSVDDEKLHVVQDMAIKSVTLTQSDEGTRAALDLVDPAAINGEHAPKAKKQFATPTVSGESIWGGE